MKPGRTDKRGSSREGEKGLPRCIGAYTGPQSPSQVLTMNSTDDATFACVIDSVLRSDHDCQPRAQDFRFRARG